MCDGFYLRFDLREVKGRYPTCKFRTSFLSQQTPFPSHFRCDCCKEKRSWPIRLALECASPSLKFNISCWCVHCRSNIFPASTSSGPSSPFTIETASRMIMQWFHVIRFNLFLALFVINSLVCRCRAALQHNRFVCMERPFRGISQTAIFLCIAHISWTFSLSGWFRHVEKGEGKHVKLLCRGNGISRCTSCCE